MRYFTLGSSESIFFINELFSMLKSFKKTVGHKHCADRNLLINS